MAECFIQRREGRENTGSLTPCPEVEEPWGDPTPHQLTGGGGGISSWDRNTPRASGGLQLWHKSSCPMHFPGSTWRSEQWEAGVAMTRALPGFQAQENAHPTHPTHQLNGRRGLKTILLQQEPSYSPRRVATGGGKPLTLCTLPILPEGMKGLGECHKRRAHRIPGERHPTAY